MTSPTSPDPDLAAVIRAWPDLPPHVREAIAVLLKDAVVGGSGPGIGYP